MGKKTLTAGQKRKNQRRPKLREEDRVHVITPEDSSASDGEGGKDDRASAPGAKTKAGRDKTPEVWLPGMELAEGEELQPDMSVYVMLQEMQVEWPCLSFDVLHDGTGAERLDFPMEASLVAGTQADRADRNKILLMRWTNLCKNQSRDYDEEQDSSSDEDGEESAKSAKRGDTTQKRWMPQCHVRAVSHADGAGINRVRALQSADASKLVVATWSERGRVLLWDLSDLKRDLDASVDANMNGNESHESHESNGHGQQMRPLFSVTGHREEGFAMDWSRREWGNLLSGDCAGSIFWTQLADGASTAQMNGRAFTGHSGSVEDLQWSPSESTVFASASVDQTVRIWDVRCDPRRPALSAHCHETDVNVISWNRSVSYLLASGADDGSFKTWDLRNFAVPASPFENTLNTPVATFKWHLGAITSLEWHPTESSVLAVSGEDHQVSLWDFAVERDAEQMDGEEGEAPVAPSGIPVPPHLLFYHQGQREVKEVHWHPQHPGVVLSTAASGFNIFKTISV